VAKKKRARKTASRGARKKTAVRRRARKVAPRPRTTVVTNVETIGLEDPNQVDLRPLKKIITAQLKRLRTGPPNEHVARAIEALEQAKDRLAQGCAHTPVSMVVGFL